MVNSSGAALTAVSGSSGAALNSSVGGSSGTALTGVGESSGAALTGVGGSSGAALTGVGESSRAALTGVGGSSGAALTGSSGAALTGVGVSVLTGVARSSGAGSSGAALTGVGGSSGIPLNCGWLNVGSSSSMLSSGAGENSDRLVANLAQSPQLLSSLKSSLIASLLTSIGPQLPLGSGQSPSIAPPLSRMCYPPKPSVLKSDKPFFLATLNNRIKKCSGCGHMFRDLVNPNPPEYLIGHMERDWFPGENFEWKMGKFQNKYYHFKMNCILQRCSLYRFPEDMANLQIGFTKPVPNVVKVMLFKEFKLFI